jgi:hypothetical protein
MSNNKPISVKVKTVKLMTALTEALASRQKQLVAHDKAEADHKKSVKEWEAKILDLIKSGKAKVTSVSNNRNWRSETDEAQVMVTLPANLAYPKEDNNLPPVWQVKQEIEELENAIAILTMSDEEFVSTSTYKGVARLIK